MLASWAVTVDGTKAPLRKWKSLGVPGEANSAYSDRLGRRCIPASSYPPVLQPRELFIHANHLVGWCLGEGVDHRRAFR